MKEFYWLGFEDRIRALANDSQGRVFTDESLRPFVEQASQYVPFLALAMLAESRGMTEQAEFWLRFVPRGIESGDKPEVILPKNEAP
jgi:hypothetical protein